MAFFSRSSPQRPQRVRRDGCGYMLITCIFTCFFLVINCVLLAGAHPLLTAAGPSWMREARINQLILFLGPVLMLYAEWRLADFIIDSFAALFRRDDDEA